MTDERIERTLGTLLRAGVILAAMVVIAGGIMAQPEVIRYGLLVLIATPVARVGFSAVAFALERDWLYVAIAGAVLVVLAYSLAAAR